MTKATLVATVVTWALLTMAMATPVATVMWVFHGEGAK